MKAKTFSRQEHFHYTATQCRATGNNVDISRVTKLYLKVLNRPHSHFLGVSDGCAQASLLDLSREIKNNLKTIYHDGAVLKAKKKKKKKYIPRSRLREVSFYHILPKLAIW